jgi:hypothetical protein
MSEVGDVLREMRLRLMRLEEGYGSTSRGGQGRFRFVRALNTAREGVERALTELGEGIY